MRLSRLGTDSSLPPDYQGFRGPVRVGPIDPRGGSAEQLPAPPTDRGCNIRRPFKEPPLTAESGGATRAALLAMRANFRFRDALTRALSITEAARKTGTDLPCHRSWTANLR